MYADVYAQIAKYIDFRDLVELYVTCKSWYEWSSGTHFWNTRLEYMGLPERVLGFYPKYDDISPLLKNKIAFIKILSKNNIRIPESILIYSPIEMLFYSTPQNFDRLISRICFDPELKANYRNLPLITKLRILNTCKPRQLLKLFKIYPVADINIYTLMLNYFPKCLRKIRKNNPWLSEIQKEAEILLDYSKTGNLEKLDELSTESLFYICICKVSSDTNLLIRVMGLDNGPDIIRMVFILNTQLRTIRNYSINNEIRNYMQQYRFILKYLVLLGKNDVLDIDTDDVSYFLTVLKILTFGEIYKVMWNRFIKLGATSEQILEIINSRKHFDLDSIDWISKNSIPILLHNIKPSKKSRSNMVLLRRVRIYGISTTILASDYNKKYLNQLRCKIGHKKFSIFLRLKNT